jgi:ribonuclease Z
MHGSAMAYGQDCRMNALFHCKLVNAPFGDPALYVETRHARQALLFDLGDISALGEGKTLKLTHVFISHAHMDHFFGFDFLLRVMLGRDKHLRLYGPPGITTHVAGKLSGYTWNLVQDYPLRLTVGEIHPDAICSTTFTCAGQFTSETAEPLPFGGVAEETPRFTVRAVQLDHGIPILAFALEERFHINVLSARLQEKGYAIGPWLNELKDLIWQGRPDDCRVVVPTLDEEGGAIEAALGDLKNEIVTINAGQKITYVADCAYSIDNVDKIVGLARGADIMFCEAAFLERDGEKARAREHLTARQAGLIARSARVKHFIPFHFSPRYQGLEEELEQEAQEAFRKG